jgi:ATP-dependent Clp protease ATP-binding subunit ClpC
MNTLEKDIKKYRPVVQLDSVINRSTLSLLRHLSFAGMTLCAAGVGVDHYWLEGVYTKTLFGGSLIFAAIWLEQMMMFSYHNSYYFRGLNSLIGLDEEPVTGATYDVAKAALKHDDDMARAFCVSDFGSQTLMRSGISEAKVNEFLNSPRQQISADMVMLPEDEIFSLIGLGKHLLSHDVEFKEMIKGSGVTTETFLGALRWVVGTYHQDKRRVRWWSKDNLSRITGIGREWSYGNAYLLERFARDVRTSAVFSTLSQNSTFANEKVKEIEGALARTKASNVLIIGEAGVGKMDLVMEVAKRMHNGKSLDAISGKHIIALDTNRLFAVAKDKNEFEVTLIKMFNEATEAGNTIVIIEHLSNFIREAEALGVFIPELLDQYLALPQIQIVATDTPGNYHTHLETLGALTRRFEEILIDSSDLSATVRVLQGVALSSEPQYKILFTFNSLQAIATAADRYIVEGVMPDKAIELLINVATKAKQADTIIITDDFVYEIVSEKTGVPAGPIKDEERELLLNLEDKLHQQVIGQDGAITAIAKTMRRARAGIQAADKPIGSFLFLGPTGVGKTETSKALAKIFFGAENKMQRLDMSEYSDQDAIEKLIGGDDSDETGTLPNMLREHPYCVLLLDEFEKAAQSVHDIFLQILDEGIFTDGRGTKVNARNTIIIATSNAGSQLILKTVRQRKELSTLTQEIIDHIVRQGIYRPELINRFDSTIIFEPLTIEEQTSVASLMMGSLYERVRARGYELEIDKDLLELLVEKGYNPEFGARPMQRVIQDLIEEKIAQKIIAGEAQKGDTIPLSKSDFTEEELAVDK